MITTGEPLRPEDWTAGYDAGYTDALEAQAERVRVLREALLDVARKAEALKRECGMDPESPQAIRNAQYMNISYAARAALDATK